MVEFDHFRMSAGLPSFVLSTSEWIERTNAVGIIVKKGRYGGTYAHKDIAFEFGNVLHRKMGFNALRKYCKAHYAEKTGITYKA
ncbi:MAG: KilA-N domain-containing protein [Bacteroidales bacterium]|nr:KilA-N domain-containing protein [Bacteroidales bacterium]